MALRMVSRFRSWTLLNRTVVRSEGLPTWGSYDRLRGIPECCCECTRLLWYPGHAWQAEAQPMEQDAHGGNSVVLEGTACPWCESRRYGERPSPPKRPGPAVCASIVHSSRDDCPVLGRSSAVGRLDSAPALCVHGFHNPGRICKTARLLGRRIAAVRIHGILRIFQHIWT